jgi:hypothetical protein
VSIFTPPHITSKIERNMHIFVKIFSPLQVVGIESPQKLSTFIEIYKMFIIVRFSPPSLNDKKQVKFKGKSQKVYKKLISL